MTPPCPSHQPLPSWPPVGAGTMNPPLWLRALWKWRHLLAPQHLSTPPWRGPLRPPVNPGTQRSRGAGKQGLGLSLWEGNSDVVGTLWSHPAPILLSANFQEGSTFPCPPQPGLPLASPPPSSPLSTTPFPLPGLHQPLIFMEGQDKGALFPSHALPSHLVALVRSQFSWCLRGSWRSLPDPPSLLLWQK